MDLISSAKNPRRVFVSVIKSDSGLKIHIVLACIIAVTFYTYTMLYIPQQIERQQTIVNKDISEIIPNTVSTSIKELLKKKNDYIPSNITNANAKTREDEGSKLKYILQWTVDKRSSLYQHMGKGQRKFKKFNCPHQNCFVTGDRSYLRNIEDFDAIVFDITILDCDKLPKQRALKQKYIFGAIESPQYYPACRPVLDNFFNWTWTYRLDSDLRMGYITIYDLNNTIIGPTPNMKWPKGLNPVDDDTKLLLEIKSKAAAWFVTNCNTRSHREDFAKKVKIELEKLNLKLDIYGRCGNYTCPRIFAKHCNSLLKKNYFFYFAFENSFGVDYVTEKILIALQNYVVPVVFGGAQYSRFLPPGSYLDARELGPKQLAKTIYDIINNKTRYHDFFRWQNHFRYKETTRQDICNLCTSLNDKKKFNGISIYENFREWWNEGGLV